MTRRVAPLFTGGLALLALATVAPAVPFTLPEPLSLEHAALATAFLATWLFTLEDPPRRSALVFAHLGVTAAALALHPMTLFGRDGTAVIFALHLLVVLRLRTRLAPEWTLGATAVAATLFAAEAILARIPAPRVPPGVLDYADVLAADERPGTLKPRLDVRILTERGTGRFVTDSRGHRNAREVSLAKEPGGYRVVLMGDSFATGYRVDQDAFVGARLEKDLRRTRPGAEVVVLGAGHPGFARWALERKALRLSPDVVVLGLTLGNDVQSSWASRHGLKEAALESLLMPPDAFLGRARRLPLALDRSLASWRAYRHAASLLRPPTITAWYRESPREVRLFDPGHGLGLFFARRPLPLVADAIETTLDDLAALRTRCDSAGLRLVVALFPQRFQVSAEEWPATLWERGLDPKAFDPEAPNRVLLEGCRGRGLDCVDLLPPLRRSCDRPCYLPRGDMHWNERGHAVAAAAIAEALGDESRARMAGTKDPGRP